MRLRRFLMTEPMWTSLGLMLMYGHRAEETAENQPARVYRLPAVMSNARSADVRHATAQHVGDG